MTRTMLRFRIATNTLQATPSVKLDAIVKWAGESEDNLLDLIDFVLKDIQVQDWTRPMERATAVDHILAVGASIYTVTTAGDGLTERIDSSATREYADAISPSDVASEELKSAWSEAYGLRPNASHAWNHSILALEAILKPIIVGNNPNATLGHVVGELAANANAHPLALRDNGLNNATNPEQTLISMLRLVWPNPDRHQGVHHRVPTLDEARGVLHVVVTIVQWARSGIIT